MEQTPTPEQSLKLINDMMLQAKKSFQKVHFHFLLWGVLFALAGLASHFMIGAGSRLHWFVWPAAGIIGGIISGIRSSRAGRGAQVVTTMDRLLQYLWLSYVLTLVLSIVALVKNGIDPNPFVLVLTGLPTFVSGALMRFRPLVIGGILFWVIGFISFFVFQQYSALVYSAAITIGYIIPGFLLKREEDGVRTT